MIDVNVVRVSVRIPVLGELGIFDEDLTRWAVPSENSFLIPMDETLTDREIDSLLPDGRTIVIRNGRAGEFDIFYRRIIPRYNPDGFAFSRPTCSLNFR